MARSGYGGGYGGYPGYYSPYAAPSGPQSWRQVASDYAHHAMARSITDRKSRSIIKPILGSTIMSLLVQFSHALDKYERLKFDAREEARLKAAGKPAASRKVKWERPDTNQWWLN